jgi:pyruvate/2-oxoglutarate dehydrogenase complex dihydrolipoamide dehydrogenase (E3) component
MTKKFDYDIGIVGAGTAGLTVAAGAAQLGAKTLLIEKEPVLGGDCLHYGCVPSKTLIRSAHVYHMMKNATRYGLPEADVRPVDFRDVRARIRRVIATIQEHDSVERFCKLGAKVFFGQPEFVDEHTVNLNGERISAKSWLISTGSEPTVPPIVGIAETPFITNKEIFYLDKLPSSMAVLGAGPIAVEMAQAFQRLGTEVTVVQRSGQILSREDADMAELALEGMRAEGVRFLLNSQVRCVRNLGTMREVVVEHGDEVVTLKVETILVAMGRSANTGGLNLEAAGVKYTPRGIDTDTHLKTRQKHIYAAGDVIGGYQFTHAAGYEGGIVVSNAVFHLPRRVNYTWMPWCTYTDPELASIGMNEKAAERAGITPSVWTEPFAGNDRSLAEEERVGKIKLVLDEKERPIGVQIFGPQAGELISEWVAALGGRVKLSTLVGAIHPYPTLAEINKRVVGNLYSKKIFSEKVQKTLKFFFDYRGRACG